MQLASLKPMRWLTLILQVISVLFSYLVELFPIGRPIAEVTDQYDSLFRPAGYTFSIWGIIYVALIVYCVYQLKPSQAGHLAYERLNKYVRFNAVMGIAWQISFRYDWIPISAAIIILMLIAGIILFSRAHYNVNRRHYNPWLTVPFSLNLAWLSVATVANLSILLRYRYIWWNGAGMEAETWLVIMLAIVLLITQSVSTNFKDFVFPLVICWACIGIWVRLKNNDEVSSNASLGAAVIAFIIFIVVLYRKRKAANVLAAQKN
jgi:hypothetical protein